MDGLEIYLKGVKMKDWTMAIILIIAWIVLIEFIRDDPRYDQTEIIDYGVPERELIKTLCVDLEGIESLCGQHKILIDI